MDKETLAFLTLINALDGRNRDADIVEIVERSAQDVAVSTTLMAKDMNPGREVWESLGFEFADIEGDDVLCRAKLPEGWTMNATDSQYWTEIRDENGMVRGKMFFKGAYYDRKARMALKQRYEICTDYDEESNTRKIYFGNNDEEIFVAGTLARPKNDDYEGFKKYELDTSILQMVAKEYANENYPDWKDVRAYWGKEIAPSSRGSR